MGGKLKQMGKKISKSIKKKKIKKNNEIQDGDKIEIIDYKYNEIDYSNEYFDLYNGNKFGFIKNEEKALEAIYSQDYEGFWDDKSNKFDFIKTKYKRLNNELSEYLEGELIDHGISFDDFKEINIKDKNNIKMTIIMIVFIIGEYKNKIDELYFIINKAKQYISQKGYFYENIINNLNNKNL